MKTAVLFFLSFPLIGFAAAPPKGTFKSSQFSEARQAAQTQGKSSDNRWSRKMDAAIVKVTAHKKADEIAPDVKKPEATKSPPVREWTNKEGKTIRAAFVEVKAGIATLRLEDGKTVEYPIDKLSDPSKAALPTE